MTANSLEVSGYGLSSYHRYWQAPAVGICYARPNPRASVVLADDLLGAGGSQYSIRPLQQRPRVGAFDFSAHHLGHLAESNLILLRASGSDNRLRQARIANAP